MLVVFDPIITLLGFYPKKKPRSGSISCSAVVTTGDWEQPKLPGSRDAVM